MSSEPPYPPWLPQTLELIQAPLSLTADAVLAEAIALFQAQPNHSCVLVFQGETLQGIVTRQDVLNQVLTDPDFAQSAIATVMSTPVITRTLDPQFDGLALKTQFATEGISHLPLFDAAQNFLGILTEKNLLAYLHAASTQNSKLTPQQSELEHDAQLYHLLVDSSPMGIFQTDANGFCTFVNARWAEITGLPSDRALGEGWSQALHPDDREKIAAEWYAAASENRPFNLEYRFQKEDGSAVWVHGRLVAAETDQENKVIGYVGSITDIQERKTLETALATILDGTATVTGYDFFNALACHLGETLGIAYVFITELEYCDCDTLKGLAYWEKGSIQPISPYKLENTPCEVVLRDGFLQLLSSLDQAFPDNQYVQITKSISYTGVVLSDPDGQPIGHICVLDTKPLEKTKAQMIRHVLEVFAARAGAELLRKRSDAALQELTATLEQQVDQRTNLLVESQQRLRLITDSIPGAIAYLDATERYQFINRTYCQWFQKSECEILGHTVKEVYGEAKYALCENYIQQVLRGETVSFETLIPCAEGVTRYIVSTFVPDLNQTNQVQGYYIMMTDISDRHQMEQELKSSKNELQALFEAMDDVILLLNSDGTHVQVISKNSDQLYCSETEVIGQKISEIFPEAQAQYFTDCIQQTMAAGCSQQFEYSLPIKGVEKRFYAICSVLSDKRLLWVARDISDYHSTKIALQQSAAELRSLFAAMGDLVMILDQQGTYCKIIPTHAQQLMRLSSERLGRTLNDFFSPEQAAQLLDCIRATLAQGTTQTCEYTVCVNDQEIWFHGSCSKLNENQVLWIARDVSDNKRAELHLQEASYRLSLATRAAKIGLWDYEIEGDRLMWDARQYEFYGVPPLEFKGTVQDWTDRVHPDDLPHMCRLFTRAFTQPDINELESEFRIVRPNGEVRHIKGNAIILRDDAGAASRVLGVNFDVTSYKTTEAELRHAKQAAESAAQTKSLFLANMSHEIRTPMNGVVGMLELLYDSSLTEQQRSHLTIAQASAESLLLLINDILDFSKVEAGKLDLEYLDFDLHHLLKNIAKTTALKAQEKGLELIVDLRELDHHIINGDPNRIQQIFTNLLSNAVKFTEQGNVILSSRLVRDETGLWLVGRVVDEGIGIASEKLQELFHPFTQLDPSTTRKYGGTGLGLAITKKLCELMDGDIAVQSDREQGSCFEFRVRVQPSETSQSFSSFEFSSFNVLLVERNPTLREILSSQLEMWEVNVTAVTTGAEAIAATTTNSFEMALINHTIADYDREQFCHRLKDIAQQTQPSFIVVVMTAIANLTADQNIKNSAVDVYLTKPVLPRELAQTLTNIGQSVALKDVRSTTAPSVAPSQSPPSQPQWSAQTRLLVVEDNRVNQLVIQSALKKIGLAADIATQGYDALRRLRESPSEQPYNLVLMDCLMPEMNGYETTERIRNGEAGERYCRVPIVALTANAMKGDREKCLGVGMDDYLSKPINTKALRTILSNWLAP